jgi:hypothetical protein
MKKLLCLLRGHKWKFNQHSWTEPYEGMIHPLAYGKGTVTWSTNLVCECCSKRIWDLDAAIKENKRLDGILETSF